MNCPNCGSKTEQSICPQCGVNTALYKRIINLSGSLYNKGLRQANENDFSGAIASLVKALDINKGNIDARNLLGLLYYELGYVGDSIKNLVLSINTEKNKNIAVEYLEKIKKSQSFVNKQDESVKLYNQALNYIKQKNEDMAIIQLKKSVDLNPLFVEAYNLLSLCYIITKETRKVDLLCDKVLTIDVKNAKALRYKEYYGSERTKVSGAKQLTAKSAQRDSNTYTFAAKSSRDFAFSTLLAMMFTIIGAVLAFSIVYFIIMPNNIAIKDDNLKILTEENIALQTLYDTETKESTQKITDLNKSILEKDTKIDDLTNQLFIKTNNQIIFEAQSLYMQEKPEEALAKLQEAKLSELPADILVTYDFVKISASKKLEATFFQAGRDLFNSKKYDESEEELLKSLKYTAADSVTAGDAYYLLGRIAEFENDSEKAIKYYEKVVNDYPDSSQINRAKQRLNALT